MRKRRAQAEPPPPPPAPAPRTRPTTRAERNERLDQVEFWMARGDGEAAVERQVRERWGLGRFGTRKLMREVRERWKEAGKEGLVERKQKQLRRIYQWLRLATSATKRVTVNGVEREVPDVDKFKFATITQLEDLIADIEGNKAPVKLELNATANAALMSVMAGMSEERKAKMLEEQKAMRSAALLAGYRDPEPERVIVEHKP